MEDATFGAGCFWHVEEAFGKVDGVLSTEVGFMGGTFENPSYDRVCKGDTGHAEVVHLKYDPAKVSYEKLLEVFFEIHDPTLLNRQGPDIGSQYRSAIFYHTPEQKKAANETKGRLDSSGRYDRPIVTEIVPAGEFYPAEEYHQKYYQKHGIRHC